MILMRGRRQLPYPEDLTRRCAVYTKVKYRAADLETELTRVEQDIEVIANRTRELADRLGERYAIFRCLDRRYDDGRSYSNADIMALSRQADQYIETIYMLEQRRKELLDEIGK
jgi:hypothetical protein